MKNEGKYTGLVIRQRKGHVQFDPDRKDQFLKHLAETGLQAQSAQMAGISVQTIVNHRKSDPVFAEAYEDAAALYCDTLVAEAVRRGYEGIEEALVFQGRTTGDVVRRYSDRLLEKLLEAKVAGFGRKTEIDVNIKGGVLLIHAQAPTPIAWEEEYGKTPVLENSD